MNIEPGDVVVCIDDKFNPAIAKLYEQLPVQDRTYTVRDVLIGVNYYSGSKHGTIRLLLNELHNAWVGKSKDSERGFDSDRFRKLNESHESNQNTRTNRSHQRRTQTCLEPA